MPDFLKGAVVGFAIAAPVGPIGVLCIRRSIARGRISGFVSGLGAATADTVFGMIAALGLGAFTGFLVAHRTPIQLFGGLFMIVLGAHMIRSSFRQTGDREVSPSAPERSSLAGDYFSTLGLTLANPSTVLSFIGIFASFGIGATVGGFAAAALVVGVFSGSAFWWLVLSGLAGWLGSRLQGSRLRKVNVAAGLSIALFGAWNFVESLHPSLHWGR